MEITRNKENLTITENDWANGSYKVKGWVEGTYIEPTPEPIEIPITEISPRQARLILIKENMLDAVEQVVKNAGIEAQITWEFSTIIKRDNPVLLYVSKTLMGKDDIWIDEMFKEASKL